MPVIFNKIHSGWLICIAVLLLVNLWLFWPFDLYFLNDDLLHIPLTDQHTFFQTNSVRPIHELLVSIDLWLYGKHAYGYHITALLLHLVVCVQLFDLAFLLQSKWLRIDNASALKASFLAVVLFLVYPQHAESLAWISGRGAILSTIFFLISLRSFLKNDFSIVTYLAGVLSFAAALFTYEQCIFIPVVLLVMAMCNKEVEPRRKQMIYATLLLATAVVYIIIRKMITHEVIGTYEGSNYLSMNISTLAGNFFRFVLRLFINPGSSTAFIVSTGLLFTMALITTILLRNKAHLHTKVIILFACALLFIILPVLSLGVSVHSFESGRYLYLPSVFLTIALSIAGMYVWRMQVYKIACIVLLFFLMAYWLVGKFNASVDYKAASNYAKQTNEEVLNHFSASTDTLHMDTLEVSVRKLPVFRLGFKTGIKWLNNNIDTNRIIVKHMVDDNAIEK